MACCTMAPACSKSVMSAPFTTAWPPIASISATTSLAGPGSAPLPSGWAPRSFTTTAAPSLASISACSRPMPRPGPGHDRHPSVADPHSCPLGSFLTVMSP